MGVAYVVARPNCRFEIRESVHTPKGPRARTLANYGILTDKVLDTARQRATRPFEADAVRASAAKASASAAARRRARGPLGGAAAPARRDARRFVESTRRMAASLESQPPPAGPRPDPGNALADLLDLVDQVSSFAAPRRREPLRFPPLARLRATRLAGE